MIPDSDLRSGFVILEDEILLILVGVLDDDVAIVGGVVQHGELNVVFLDLEVLLIVADGIVV
jgi:hypothetical protein